MSDIPEMTKIKEVEAEFWREQFYAQVKKTAELQEKIERYKSALGEYKAAAEFLSASGDNPADYWEETV